MIFHYLINWVKKNLDLIHKRLVAETRNIFITIDDIHVFFYSKQQCNIEQHSFSQLMHKKRTLYKSIQNPFWLLKKGKQNKTNWDKKATKFELLIPWKILKIEQKEKYHLAEDAVVVRKRVGKGDEKDDIRWAIWGERTPYEVVENESPTSLHTVLY